jgi:hypothetical protein
MVASLVAPLITVQRLGAPKYRHFTRTKEREGWAWMKHTHACVSKISPLRETVTFQSYFRHEKRFTHSQVYTRRFNDNFHWHIKKCIYITFLFGYRREKGNLSFTKKYTVDYIIFFNQLRMKAFKNNNNNKILLRNTRECSYSKRSTNHAQWTC